MRLASCIMLALGAVTTSVLAGPVQKLKTLKELDDIVQQKGKVVIEWNVPECSECDRMRAEFASHGDLEGIDFVSLDIKVIDPDNNDTVNSYTATVGYDVNDTYEDADAEELGDFIQEFVVAPDKENSVGLFELYGMETDIEFVRLDPQQVQDAAQRAGLARFLAFEAYHNGAKADQYAPRSGTGANSQDDPQLNAFIERLRDRA
ncbi:hypothetical protein CPB97_002540 [Podila verticillata]|nr:hypothetical protein CPB97_002540 [Podila verticillata]